MNQTLDALNVNNSRLTSLSVDLKTSMQPFTTFYESNAQGVLTEKQKWTTGCRSLYFIGTPYCDSEVFQGGLSTANRHVQAQLLGSRLGTARMRKQVYSQPVIVFISDVLLEIYSHKPIGRPQACISIMSIEALMARLR